MKGILTALIVLGLVCGCLEADTEPTTTTDTNPPVTTSLIIITTTSTSSTTTTLLGTVGSRCQTYRDCKSDLLCKGSKCTAPPPYAQHFIKIELQKRVAGTNMSVAASAYRLSDEMYVELTPKPDTTGSTYSDVNNAVTGEKTMITTRKKIDAAKTGTMGWKLPTPDKPGSYEINVYYNDNQTYTATFEVTK